LPADPLSPGDRAAEASADTTGCCASRVTDAGSARSARSPTIASLPCGKLPTSIRAATVNPGRPSQRRASAAYTGYGSNPLANVDISASDAVSSSMPAVDSRYCSRTGLTSTSSPSTTSKSLATASVGRREQARNRTGACGGVGAPECSHVAMPAARNDVSSPRVARNEAARPRISAARTRASANAARSRTRSDKRVGRPARSIDTPPGCAVVRSRAPLVCSTYQSSVFAPPSDVSCRRQPASAAATASVRSGVCDVSLSNGAGVTRRG
jgi:hypothetical protein